MAAIRGTENELLEARILRERMAADRERALAGLFTTLRDVALDIRDLIRAEREKHP